jgi:hypothetical protein
MGKSGNDRRENGNDPSEIRFQVADREGVGITEKRGIDRKNMRLPHSTRLLAITESGRGK